MNSDPGDKTIFLVGFMACGKTTVGAALAARLNRQFVDLDPLIAAKAGCSIAELIARDGEPPFRQMEAETLRETAQNASLVIAPGGGAITRRENRAAMDASGLTIWLDAPFELCWQRIQQDAASRPLAATEAAARDRYEQRLPLYAQSTIRINIHEAQTPDDIAASIAAAILAHRPSLSSSQ
ncbi:MAG: shikimate kinase [Blastocatellia bacterium]